MITTEQPWYTNVFDCLQYANMEAILIYDYKNTVQVRADHEQCETEKELVEYTI